MGFNAQPRRLLTLASVLVISGCSTQKPATTTKPAVPLPAPALAPATTIPQPPVAPQPEPPAPIHAPRVFLSDGPWTACNSPEATIAVVVSVRTNGLFSERAGVHFLRPARTTTYRLLQLRPSEPITIATKMVPEACSISFHLGNDTSSGSTPYSVHSSLKQIPVDPTRAITLQLRVNTATASMDESLVLNGTDRTERERGPISATVEITSPEAAAEKLSRLNEALPAPIAAPSDEWDALHKKFQLTGQESRTPGWFRLFREASLQFPDIRLTSELIEINDEHTFLRLLAPVQIDWEGRLYTAGDTVIRVAPGSVQLEAADVTAR